MPFILFLSSLRSKALFCKTGHQFQRSWIRLWTHGGASSLL